MKTKFSLLVMMCLLLPCAQGEPLSEHHKLALELVELISINRPDEKVFKKQVAEHIEQGIPQLNLNENEAKLFREAAMGATKRVTMDRVTEMIAVAHAKKLSVDELKVIIAFYKSDEGKAWQRQGGAIEVEMKAQMMALVTEVLKETKQRFEELKKQNPE